MLLSKLQVVSFWKTTKFSLFVNFKEIFNEISHDVIKPVFFIEKTTLMKTQK